MEPDISADHPDAVLGQITVATVAPAADAAEVVDVEAAVVDVEATAIGAADGATAMVAPDMAAVTVAAAAAVVVLTVLTATAAVAMQTRYPYFVSSETACSPRLHP